MSGGTAPAASGIPNDLLDALRRMSIVSADTQVSLSPMAGGVSSDIYRADLPSRVICVKRALAKLKVAADWRAPVERSRYEVEWMRVAAAVVAGSVPEILGADAATGSFAMAFLPPHTHPVWKTRLMAGSVAPEVALAVGDVLGRIHAATADRPDLAARFPTDDIFYAIRLEPYLVATARAHADLAPRLHALVETTRTTRRALVHGDFSPKNLLVGTATPRSTLPSSSTICCSRARGGRRGARGTSRRSTRLPPRGLRMRPGSRARPSRPARRRCSPR